MKTVRKPLIVLMALLIAVLACMGIANGIQHDWGRVRIETGFIETTLVDTADPVSIGYKLYVPADAPMCRKLLKVYGDCTGLEAKAHCIGGGTYAKSIPNILAFGPCFPDDEVREHKPDEFCTLDWLKKNMNILAEAIYELAVK